MNPDSETVGLMRYRVLWGLTLYNMPPTKTAGGKDSASMSRACSGNTGKSLITRLPATSKPWN